ncbi:helix-turn-helix transcriptional regulator [Halosimplex amylolyticum]|uniref:helix-turn-helix transcriptional regulator n=1 Tax=Halosimplex amylolyticum TaxID=3396616 RepID=UPI003F572788
MTTESGAVPPDALEDIAYLSRSPNRVRILDALTDGPYTRRELEAFTEASRTTLDRIVNELEERGWAERTIDGDYVATPIGDHLVDQFMPFVDSIVAIRRLDEAVAWIPTDDWPIGLHHFRDASVRWPAQDDPMETIDYFIDLMQNTTEFRVLTNLAAPAPLATAMRDRVVAERLTVECVVSAEIVEYMRARPDRQTRWREMIEGGASLFRYEGVVPCNMYIFDDTVLIKKGGAEPIEEGYGVPIQSENETVLSWAHDLMDQCREAAIPVDAEAFTEGSTLSETSSNTK